MKYPCGLIQDLLPLYIDGVCSDESKAAIEQHLPECSSCKEYYSTMCEADNMVIDTHIEDRERQKAASLQAVKKKLLKKQIIIAMAAVVALVVIAFSVVGVLQNITEIVEYDDNISVSMVDGDLVGRLQGSQEVYVRIKQITNTVDGQEKKYLFFCVSDTKWNDLTTSSDMFSEYTLCFADKGADTIQSVYYYTGDYTGIEAMSNEELQKVINASQLLWSK